MPDNAKSPPEPSMEEIIASISRIITEEKTQAGPPSSPAGEKQEILELTEALNEDGSVRRVTPFEPKATSAASGSAAADEPSKPTMTGPIEPDPPHRDVAIEPKPETSRERIVSAATSGAAAAAFAQLGALPRERRRESELPLGAADRTLEDIVRDMLRPLLETWLNENLPGIVERLVRQEISRVVGEAGLG
jgi:uncharacterized protein